MRLTRLRAAGAVVWRGAEDRAGGGRRPPPALRRLDLPQGQAEAGEHVIAAALREVREETGLTVALGRALPAVHYPLQGRLKTGRLLGGAGAR